MHGRRGVGEKGPHQLRREIEVAGELHGIQFAGTLTMLSSISFDWT